MTNLEKYNSAFIEVFAVEEPALNEGFCKKAVNAWDSVHQLSIIANLEEAFDIMFEPEDIMAFTGYQLGREILVKYDVNI